MKARQIRPLHAHFSWLKFARFLTYFGLIAFAIVVGVAPRLNQALMHQSGNDFYDIYYSAKATLQQRASFFDLNTVQALFEAEGGRDKLAPVTQSPFSILTFSWLLNFNVNTASIIWQTTNWLLLLIAVIGLSKIASKSQGSMPKPQLLLIFTCAIASMFGGILDNAGQGQTDLLSLVAITFAILLTFQQTRVADTIAGGLIALAILCKVFPGIVLGFYLINRRWRVPATTILAMGVLVFCSLIWISWVDYAAYPGHLLSGPYFGEGSESVFNYSLKHAGHTIIDALQLPKRPRIILVNFLLAPMVILPVLHAKQFRDEHLVTSNAASVLRLCSYLLLPSFVMSNLWDHHLVFALPTIFLLFALYIQHSMSWKPYLCAISVASFLIGIRHGIFAYDLVKIFRLTGQLLLLTLNEWTIRRLLRNNQPTSVPPTTDLQNVC